MKRTSNNYIETYTGKKFYVTDPQPEDISIVDICHALSMMCRYTGHTERFYSVAEHSVNVANNCSPENALWGLLHDASEAYLADIASPVKPFLHNYKELESGVMVAICDKFDLPKEMPEEVHKIDMELLRVEAFNLMKSKGEGWAVNEHSENPMLNIDIKGYYPKEAKLNFLETFNLLSNGR